jgi:hypothetical protein
MHNPASHFAQLNTACVTFLQAENMLQGSLLPLLGQCWLWPDSSHAKAEGALLFHHMKGFYQKSKTSRFFITCMEQQASYVSLLPWI